MTTICVSLLFAIQASVTGIVTSDGEPVSGTTLILRAAGMPEVRTVTAPDGRFAIEDVQPGIYEVSIIRNNRQFQISSLLIEQGRNDLRLLWPTAGAIEREGRFREAFSLGSSALNAGRYDEAIRQFNEALALDSTQATVWASLALASIGAGRYEQALDHGLMAVRLAPAEAAYRNNLGSTLFRMGRYDDAITRYQEAAELNPDGRGLYLSNAAAAHLANGDTRAAVDMYRHAVADPNVPAAAWYQYGVLLERTGDKTGAVNALRRYLEVAPNGAHAEHARARLEALGNG